MKRALPFGLVLMMLENCAPTGASPVSKLAPVESAPSRRKPADKPVVRAPANNTGATQPVTPQQAAARQAIAFSFERVLEGDFRHVAIEAPPYAAALSTERVYLHNARGWHSEQLPPNVGEAQVFLGRDFRPRLLGTHSLKGSSNNVYVRWTQAGIRPARNELGHLARSTQGALIAVLGINDPEIVCSPGNVCIIKRLSGWTTLPTPNNLTHVAISEGSAYALSGQRLLRSEADRWAELGPQGTWGGAVALTVAKGQAVVLATNGDIHSLTEGAPHWHHEPSPVLDPRAIWAGPGQVLWIGGRTLAQRGGVAWRHADTVKGLIHAIAGRGASEVWLGTSEGLLRGTASD